MNEIFDHDTPVPDEESAPENVSGGPAVGVSPLDSESVDDASPDPERGVDMDDVAVVLGSDDDHDGEPEAAESDAADVSGDADLTPPEDEGVTGPPASESAHMPKSGMDHRSARQIRKDSYKGR